MKIKLSLILFTVLLFSLNAHCQRVSKEHLIVYKTYNDFIQKKGADYGLITDFDNHSWGGNKFIVLNEGKEEKINMNDFWGYEIGAYLFRMNKNPRMPMYYVKTDKKVFYIDGYFLLPKAIFGADKGTTIRESDGVFYSDNLNSEIFEISKIVKKEKDNPDFNNLIKCVKAGNERYGEQAKFNGYLKCLQLDDTK